MKIIQLIKSYFAIDRKLSYTQKRIDRSLQRADGSMLSINKKIDQQELLLVKMRQYKRDIEDLGTSLQAARAELEIAKDITVPALIAAGETMVSRWEAETKVNVMRSTIAQNSGVIE